MRVSEIVDQDICTHIREEWENLDDNDMKSLNIMKSAAINYCCGFTGLTEKELDKYEDITIAILSLIADMWNNRDAVGNLKNINPTVDTILSMHCINLLPEAEN